jgi:phenylpropionate dioxygenase-like ring-hydroxylating dioxygenase large terminal subunit
MYIKNQWYLACLLDELNVKPIVSKKICGESIVVFKNENGDIGVVEDRCCHRNVQLSLGYIKGNNIKCGYHGWEYDCSGTCVQIPSLSKDDKIPTAIRIKSYKVVIKHKSVWIWIGEDSLADESMIPPMPELDKYPIVYNYHSVNADLTLVAESLFDAYHINHVHRNSIKTFMGNLYDGKIDFNVTISERHLEGKYWRANDGSFFEKFYFGFNKLIETRFGFWFPNISKLDIRFKNRHMVIYEHFYQIDEDNVCMCQITAWKNILDFFPPFAKWFMLRKSINIVREDLAFLENNKRIKRETGNKDILIKSDEVTHVFMKLWNRNLMTKNKNEEHA